MGTPSHAKPYYNQKRTSIVRCLQRRGNTYFVRIKVPRGIHENINKSEIVRSLKTTDYSVALRRISALEPLISKLFQSVQDSVNSTETVRKSMSTFSNNTINSLISKYVNEVLEEDEQWRLKSTPSYRDLEGQEGALIEQLEADTNALMVNNLRGSEDAADVLLMGAGLPFDKGGLDYKRLCRDLLKARIEAYKVILRRSQGDYSSSASFVTTIEEPGLVSPMLSEAINQYTTERASTSWTPRSAKMACSGLQQFLEFAGDKPIHEFTKGEIKAYREALQKLPTNIGKKYPGKTISEVLAMRLEPELSVASINKLVGYVCSLYNFAIEMEWTEKNPASGLKLKEGKAANEQRCVFSPDQLGLLFDAEYLAFREAAPHRFWVPLIMLCNGTRLEEAAQLTVSDVIEVEGIQCFSINADGADKTLKTKDSRRVVPIHPFLLSLGFLNYVDGIRKKSVVRLFPNLVKIGSGYGHAISKWFNARLRKLGVTDKRVVLYSTRHTLATMLKRADVQDFTISEILGHKVQSMSVGRYGKKLEPDKLLVAIKNADFEELLQGLMSDD